MKRRVARELDSTDIKILAKLQENARITNVELARAVNLSPSPCLERLKRLEADGFVRDYVARLDPTALGMTLLLFVEVNLNRTTADAFEAFHRKVVRVPEILECHMVAGGFDYLLKVRLSDIREYRLLLAEILTDLPFVRETRSYVVMEEIKESTALPLR
ncbi:MAG TPA: Lrp/AsnC ligand binding domain-containing protein [Alphaproteobacteria bacterium]|nr:Lrp/AsnC ligand binding domain-containing protein [Alphaproteobacteria bacterium]